MYTYDDRKAGYYNLDKKVIPTVLAGEKCE